MPTDTTTNPTETRTANPATSATCGGGAHSNSQWGGHVLVENVIEVVVVAKGLFENTFCVCVRACGFGREKYKNLTRDDKYV